MDEYLSKQNKDWCYSPDFYLSGKRSHFNETVFMKINTMGVTQALNILTRAI